MSSIVEDEKKLVRNLSETAKNYLNTKKSRATTAREFYKSFLKNYIFMYNGDKAKASRELEIFFGKDKLRVIAIDGTMYTRKRRGCLAFYVLASPLVYELDLKSGKLLRIEDDSLKNVMMLIPIPLSEIFLMSEEIESKDEETELNAEYDEEDSDVFIFESQKIGKIDSKLMKLSEVYAIYSCLEIQSPDIVMYDGSLFKDFSFSNRSAKQISLHKGKILQERLNINFFEILKSFPINKELKIPSKHFTREFIVAELLNSDSISLNKANDGYNFHSSLFDETVFLSNRKIEYLRSKDFLQIEQKEGTTKIMLKDGFKDSYEKLKEMFLRVCEEGFDRKSLEAFRIYFTESIYRYFSESDIDTLCRIGYLNIIERCWKEKIILFSIIKDTTERLFIDYFLSVLGPRHIGLFEYDQKLLPMIPSTDAGMIFDISTLSDELTPPIATIEFDPAISAVYSMYNFETKSFELISRSGIQERQFLRFFIQLSQMKSGRKSYVYTIDRIMYPCFDEGFSLAEVPISSRDYHFAFYEKPSLISKQILNILLLLTSNKHDMVFGYPDPLFDVDQHVKTLGKTHLETLDIALSEIDMDEFSATERQRRAIGGG